LKVPSSRKLQIDFADLEKRYRGSHFGQLVMDVGVEAILQMKG
jgi:hypothetical protein